METGAEDKNQQTAIYVMTHKAFTPPPDPLYIPLHVWEIIPEITFPKKTVITVN